MISSARTPPRDGLSALLAFVPRVFRAKWIGLVAGVLGLAGTAVGVLLTQRLYRSETVLLYEKGLAGGEESSRGLGIRLQDSFSSRVRLEGLIKKNKLYPRLVKKRGLVEAADEMNAHVKVIIREGYAYRVSYDTDDRDRAQQVLTQLVQSVIDEETERRRRQADETKNFLDAERARADADVKVKEAALGNFLSRHPQLAGVSGSAPGATIRAAESGAGPADTFSLEMQAANIEDAIAKAKMGGQPGQPVMKGGRMLDPSLVAAQSKAAADLQAARRDLAAKEARFTNDHPDVKAAVTAASQAEKAYRLAEAAAAASATTSPTASSGDAPASDGSASGAGQVAGLQRAPVRGSRPDWRCSIQVSASPRSRAGPEDVGCGRYGMGRAGAWRNGSPRAAATAGGAAVPGSAHGDVGGRESGRRPPGHRSTLSSDEADHRRTFKGRDRGRAWLADPGAGRHASGGEV